MTSALNVETSVRSLGFGPSGVDLIIDIGHTYLYHMHRGYIIGWEHVLKGFMGHTAYGIPVETVNCITYSSTLQFGVRLYVLVLRYCSAIDGVNTVCTCARS